MNLRHYVLIASVIAAGFLMPVLWKFVSRNAYEAAEYTVERTDTPFEIRQYPDLMVATTLMTPKNRDGSFMRLFGYISGKNKASEEIAMTVPVFIDDQTSDDARSMAFVLPRSLSESGAPAPLNADVQVDTRTGGRFAVIRFSGELNDQTRDTNEKKLRDWMAENDLESAGQTAESAGYDPPLTPGFLKRNEVLIRILK